MSDRPESTHSRASRRRVLQTVTGLTTLGVLGTGVSTTAAADPGLNWKFNTRHDLQLFYVTENYVYTDRPDELYAIDPNDGEIGWTFPANDSFSIAYEENDVVYASTRDNTIYAINNTSGSEKWRFGTSGIPRLPVVNGDALFLGDYGGNVYSIDKSDGTSRWAIRTKNGVANVDFIDSGIAYVQFPGDRVSAVDIQTGESEWDFELDTSWGFGIPFEQFYVVHDSQNGIYGVNKSDGTVEWEIDVPVSWPLFLEPIGGKIYTRSYDENVYAIDPDNGSIIWSFSTGSRFNHAVYHNNEIYMSSRDNNVYKLDPETGQQSWQVNTGAENIIQPAILGDTLYAGNRDGEVNAIDTTSGDIIWTFETGGDVWGVSTLRGSILVRSNDGYIYSLHDTETGDDTGEQGDGDEKSLEELTIESVEMTGTVLDPVPVAVEISPASAVEQVAVEVAAPDDIDGLGRREVELDERSDGRFEGELVPYSAVGTLDATVTLTVSDSTEVDVGETVVVRPKAFTTDEYLGYQLGQGYIEETDLELLVKKIGEKGIDKTFEAGTKAAVQALVKKAGLGGAQAAAAAAIAGKVVGLGLTIGSFVPEAGVATETTAFVYPEADDESESLSISDSLTVTAGTDVFPLIEVTQGDLFAETLSYSIEDRTTDAAATREVPFSEAHRPARGHKALILPFEELTYSGESEIVGEYELASSYGGINRPARITIEEARDGRGSSDDELSDTSVEDLPGFGVGGALTSLGGAAYLLHRRVGDTEQDEE